MATTTKTPPKKAAKKSSKPSNRGLTTMPVTYYDINERFEKIRQEEGLTIEQFAEKLAVTTSYAKMIVYKYCVPNIYAIRNLHKAFKRSYDYIIDGKPERK